MRRLIIGLILAVSMMSGSSQSAEAQLIPNMYNFVFGGPYYRTAYYGPTYGYGGYYGYRSYYRASPVVSYYAPSYSLCNSCSPCSSCCSPCGVSCSPCSSCGGAGCSTCSSGCAGGNCSTNSGAASQPQPDDDWRSTPGQGEGPAPRTFRDDESGTPPAEPADPGFGPDNNEGRQPPDEGGFADESATERESLKPAESVPQREAAPIKEPEAGGTPGGDNSNPAGNGELSFPSLNVDEKVTWRPVPSRKRLTIRSRFPTPSIARTRVNPNDSWVPVTTVTKIVSK